MSSRPATSPGWLAHYAELLRAWRRRAGPEAEDAMQDAAVQLLERGSDHIEHPQAYLRRSMFNGLVNRQRHAAALPLHPLHELTDAEHPGTASAEAEASSRQMLGEISAALDELPLVCRQVYLLHRLEGRSHAEIAEILGISRDMVPKHMGRVLRHLAQCLQHHTQGERP